MIRGVAAAAVTLVFAGGCGADTPPDAYTPASAYTPTSATTPAGGGVPAPRSTAATAVDADPPPGGAGDGSGVGVLGPSDGRAGPAAAGSGGRAGACPAAAVLLAALRTDAPLYAAVGRPARLTAVTCADAYAFADVTRDTFAVFHAADATWRPLNAGTARVCADVVPHRTRTHEPRCTRLTRCTR
ncbi:hypothetical protein GCM10010124_15880 [Pilimelia terevasa]|uniref:Uncharacterized protein n=1 Tax=Pilimelia terevasa TaxID=53372 RepID=A0A8J3BNP1_9ACTN|nr:hypothetical protein [Pilimelia terevasa]GGK24204.1 hypothetical protein GCM10010124_15880 [Pilimelia terevasa]